MTLKEMALERPYCQPQRSSQLDLGCRCRQTTRPRAAKAQSQPAGRRGEMRLRTTWLASKLAGWQLTQNCARGGLRTGRAGRSLQDWQVQYSFMGRPGDPPVFCGTRYNIYEGAGSKMSHPAHGAKISSKIHIYQYNYIPYMLYLDYTG